MWFSSLPLPPLSPAVDDNRLIDRLHASCHFRSHKNILSSIPVRSFFLHCCCRCCHCFCVCVENRLQHHLLCTHSGKWVQFRLPFSQFTFFCEIMVLWLLIQISPSCSAHDTIDLEFCVRGGLPQNWTNRNKFQTNVKWCTTNGFGLQWMWMWVCVAAVFQRKQLFNCEAN